jgi:hypothetical protein
LFYFKLPLPLFRRPARSDHRLPIFEIIACLSFKSHRQTIFSSTRSVNADPNYRPIVGALVYFGVDDGRF